MLWIAPAGLFADAFSVWLLKLGPGVEVLRYHPGTPPVVRRGIALLLTLLDSDAIPAARLRGKIRSLCARLPNVPLVVMGSKVDYAFVAERIMGAGASAYLPKTYTEGRALRVLGGVLGSSLKLSSLTVPSVETAGAKRQAARSVASPGVRRGNRHPYGLTDRELDVLQLACEGITNLQIAKRCGITEGVVKLHLHRVYGKLGVQGRVQAIRIVDHLDAIRQLNIKRTEAKPPLIDWLLPHMSHERHRKGKMLFRKGQPGNALYYLQKGSVRLPEIDAEMREGDLFGEIGIFAPGQARTSSAQCKTDTHLFCLTAEQAQRLCFENPQFAYYVLCLIANRLVEERARTS